MRYLLFALLFCLSLQAAPDRITRPVSANRATVRNSVHPRVRAQFDTGAADQSLAIDHATIYFRLAPGVEAFLAQQQNPASPDFHRWLTPEQFGDRFGLSGNDLGAIADWLRSQGLTVNDVARGRTWIAFSGTAAQVSNAFRTQLRRYRINGEDHFANASDISVPDAFASLVVGVRGLDDFAMKPLYHGARPLTQVAHNTSSSGRHYLTPGDYSTIYNISPLYSQGIDGTGQKIAVIGRTDIDLEDIRTFRKRYGLPANDPQVMLFGTDPKTRSGDLIEADLDLEWAGATAPNATIIYVNSLSVDLSAQYAVDQNIAPVMTFSYGLCEQSTTDTLRSIAQQANAQGITWMVSSGDGGAATCDYGLAQTPQATLGATVAYPSSIPEITSIGGTEFNEGSGDYWNATNDLNQASAKGYIPERVWNESISQNAIVGGGGGASLFYPKPSWQTGPGVPNDKARDLPDISLSASGGHDGYLVVSGGSTYIVGGTSASSPAFAGIVALLNQSLTKLGNTGGQGNINPALYRMAQTAPDAFHDIVEGDNTVQCAQAAPGCVNGQLGFHAAPGYDLATGLGSVDAFNLVTKWNAGAKSTTSLQSDVSSAALSDTVKLTATVSGSSGAPTGSVVFVSGDNTLGSANLIAGANGSVATLSASASLIGSASGLIYALYSGDPVYGPSSGSLTVSLKFAAGDPPILLTATPNPVHETSGAWPYTLTLSQQNGLEATITEFSIDSLVQTSAWRTTKLPATGSISTSLVGHDLKAPVDRKFHVSGTTADGGTWARDLVVAFLPPLAPNLDATMVLTASPDVIRQNPQADPSCQWQQQITAEETSGFAISLTRLTAGTDNFTSKIPSLFGTTRLAPFGRLTATVCFSDITAPSTKTYTLTGVSEDGATVMATSTASFAGPSAASSAASVSRSSIALSGTDSASFNLNYSGGTSAWKITVAGGAAKWLTAEPSSGSGPATITLKSKTAGLSNGVYAALLTVQSSDAMPQSLQVAVSLAVGASGEISIRGVGNAASGVQSFAPGMLIAVYGSNLAPSTLIASRQPLPLSLAGTSATVNGVSAPLWFVSPDQINIQLPYETSAGPAVLGVNNNGKVAQFTFSAAPAAPGIFMSEGFMVPFNSGKRGQTIVGFITGDGDVTPTLASGATPPSTTRLSQYPQSRLPFTMTVGGVPATVAFKGIVTGLIGVTQVNFTVPADAPLGVQPVVVTVGGVSSAAVNLTVREP